MARLAPDGKGKLHYEITFDDQCRQLIESRGGKVNFGVTITNGNDFPSELGIRADVRGLYKLKQKNGKTVVSAPVWKIQGEGRISEDASLRLWHMIDCRIEGDGQPLAGQPSPFTGDSVRYEPTRQTRPPGVWVSWITAFGAVTGHLCCRHAAGWFLPLAQARAWHGAVRRRGRRVRSRRPLSFRAIPLFARDRSRRRQPAARPQ